MNIEEKIIDYISGSISPEERSSIEQLIDTDPAVASLYEEYNTVNQVLVDNIISEPDNEWAQNFAQSLSIRPSQSGKVVSLETRRWYSKLAAAAAVFIIGLLAVNNWNQSRLIDRVDNDLYALRQQMESNLSESSVSTRIKAVRYSHDIDDNDEAILSILTKTMNDDPSSHVRLAAVEALSKWINQPIIKESMIAALYTEQDPSVQILLIEILASTKDGNAADPMDYLITDEATQGQAQNVCRFESLLKN